MKKINYPLYTKQPTPPDSLNLFVEDLRQMDDYDFQVYTEELRLYLLNIYEKKHFPTCVVKGRSLDKIIKDLRSFNNNFFNDIFYEKEKIIKCFDKTFSGINHWFPEMYDVKRSSSNLSVIDPFRNQKIFHNNFNRLIKKDALKFYKKNRLVKVFETLHGFRILNGVVPLSNFPSGIAKFLYIKILNKEKFKHQNDLHVLDQSMGWGGRLIGALSALTQGNFKNKKLYYHGTDVNTLTHDRFQHIINFWKENISNENFENFNFFKSTIPAENLCIDEPFFNDKIEKYDMSFTSPPYFNTEKYSNDETQSYLKYSTYSEWKDGFLYGMIQSTHKLLKKNGEFWINIADVKNRNIKNEYLTLENDTKKIAESFGFKYKGHLKMLLISLSGNGTEKNSRNKILGKNIVEFQNQKLKYEPIFCFIKK